jgi:hypothetical protein
LKLEMAPQSKYLWLNWTISCALGELLGFSAAALVAVSSDALAASYHIQIPRLAYLGIVGIGGLIEGGILGWFQWRVMQRQVPNIPGKHWIGVTALIGMGGWILGMIYPLFFADSVQSAESARQEPGPFLYFTLVVLFGAAMGAAFGFFQWIVLRRYALKSWYWIPANSIGWALGMLCIFVAAAIPDQHSSTAMIRVLIAAGGITAGLCVGAVTGLFLLRITPPESPNQ